MGAFTSGVGAFSGASKSSLAGSKGTTAIGQEQLGSSMASEASIAKMTDEARQQAQLSVATKQADAQSAREAKQSEAMGQI